MLGQAGRNFNVHTHILIAAATTVDILDALAAQTEDGAGLCALRNRIFNLSVNGRYLQGIAQCSLREGNRDFADDVVAIARENRVRTNADGNNDIAAWTAIGTSIALTAQLNGLTVIDTRWNFDLQGSAIACFACAAALLTRLSNNFTGTAAVRASCPASGTYRAGYAVSA